MRGRRRLGLAGLAGVSIWLLLLLSVGAAAAASPPARPPYPDAVTGQRVYDYAGIFSPGTVAAAESRWWVLVAGSLRWERHSPVAVG